MSFFSPSKSQWYLHHGNFFNPNCQYRIRLDPYKHVVASHVSPTRLSFSVCDESPYFGSIYNTAPQFYFLHNKLDGGSVNNGRYSVHSIEYTPTNPPCVELVSRNYYQPAPTPFFANAFGDEHQTLLAHPTYMLHGGVKYTENDHSSEIFVDDRVPVGNRPNSIFGCNRRTCSKMFCIYGLLKRDVIYILLQSGKRKTWTQKYILRRGENFIDPGDQPILSIDVPSTANAVPLSIWDYNLGMTDRYCGGQMLLVDNLPSDDWISLKIAMFNGKLFTGYLWVKAKATPTNAGPKKVEVKILGCTDLLPVWTEYGEVTPPLLRLLVGVIIIYFAVSLVVLTLTEPKWSVWAILYFCMVTITTVGYGAISPKNVYSRLFSIIHMFCSAAIVLIALFNIRQYFLEEKVKILKNNKQYKKMKGIEVKRGLAGAFHLVSGITTGRITPERDDDDDDDEKPLTCVRCICYKCLRTNWFWFIVWLIVFVAFYMGYSSEDCKDTTNLTFVDALYMTTATATTVGYGDFNGSCDTTTQMFTFFMIVIGCVLFQLVTENTRGWIMSKFDEDKQKARTNAILNNVELQFKASIGKGFNSAESSADHHDRAGPSTRDESSNGEKVSKFEFLERMVLSMGHLSKDDLEKIMKVYDEKTGENTDGERLNQAAADAEPQRCCLCCCCCCC